MTQYGVTALNKDQPLSVDCALSSPHIAPVSRKLALDRCEKVRPGTGREAGLGHWALGWTETNSRSYWLREAQVSGRLWTSIWRLCEP